MRWSGAGAAALLMTLGLAACAPPPRADRMAPEIAPAARPVAAKTVRIEPVTGGTETKGWDKPSLDDRAFQEALIAGLARSGLVRGVVTTGAADWALRATIVSQAMEGTWRTNADLMVRYDITARDGSPVWGETVVSHATLGVGDVMDGQARMRAVIEAVARDNITQMLSRLGRWSGAGP